MQNYLVVLMVNVVVLRCILFLMANLEKWKSVAILIELQLFLVKAIN